VRLEVLGRRHREARVDVQNDLSAQMADQKQLRRTLGSFATGVTVLTVGGAAQHGMTANSFTAVSLDPPLVLVCVERDAIMHGALTGTRRFGISVLASHQEWIARHFADRRRPLGAEQFAQIDCVPGVFSDAPLINEAAAHLECDLSHSYEGGDHTIFVAHLLAVSRRLDAGVLVFLNGQFHRFDSMLAT